MIVWRQGRFSWRFASAGPAEKRLAAPEEVAFLMGKGAVTAKRTLVTVMAACDALQHFGAPASTVAAVQGLQGAKPLTPAELSKLSSFDISRSSADGDDDGHCTGHDTQAALQQPLQAACPPARASCSMPEHSRRLRSASHKRAGSQPGSAALRETVAGLVAARGAAEVQKSAGGASLDADATQSSGKQSERAEWSCHSSDSEQEEEAARAASQPQEVDFHSQPTQAGLDTPRQPYHEACNTAGTMPEAAVITSRRATEKAQDEHSAKALHDR